MEKKWHKLIYKQVQPIHIGQGRFGVLGETRIFIPGWTMWGALTKAYNLQVEAKLNENQGLFEEISNFFPATDTAGENILLPKFQNGEFYLGNFSEQEFRAKFCGVVQSTAVMPISRQAMDASLHEIEVIYPKMKNEVKDASDIYIDQLYWVGYVKVEGEISDFLTKIFVGGDRRYSLGLMEFISKQEVAEHEAKNPKLWYIDYDLVKDNDKEHHGQLELLPEFEFIRGEREKNYKVNLEHTGYFYMPGHKFENIQGKYYKGKIKE